MWEHLTHGLNVDLVCKRGSIKSQLKSSESRLPQGQLYLGGKEAGSGCWIRGIAQGVFQTSAIEYICPGR